MCHVKGAQTPPVATPNYAPSAAGGYGAGLTPLATGYAAAPAAPQANLSAVLSLITSLFPPVDSLMGGWQGIGGANLGAPTAYAAAGSGGLNLQAAFSLTGFNSAGAQSYGSLAGAFALADSPLAAYGACRP